MYLHEIYYIHKHHYSLARQQRVAPESPRKYLHSHLPDDKIPNPVFAYGEWR